MAEVARVEIVQPVEGFQLTLTEKEASVLLDTAMRIGGHYQDSPRRHWDDIRLALENAGVTRLPNSVDGDTASTGNIFFRVDK